MADELLKLFSDLDIERLRFNRPTKSIFLCGGVIGTGKTGAFNLRDYLIRKRKIERELSAVVVLAEKAVQLYRDTNYKDLITFEEDIARISAIVLVIAESAGSLAELGAFATNLTIQPFLRIILQADFEREESFVRFGPIKRVENTSGREMLGIYPWQFDAKGMLIPASANAHFRAIKKFIQDHVDEIPSSELYRSDSLRQPFYVIYWVIQLALAIPYQELEKIIRQILPDVSPSDVKDKLFCLELSGWISRIAYSDKNYFYAPYEADPFDYAFKAGVVDRDSTRRKFLAAKSLKKMWSIPGYVRRTVAGKRKGGS